MSITFFTNAYFLQSLGLAIADSFWQTAALWLLYKAITRIDKQLTSLIKYYLSLTLLALSFTWFVITVVNNYNKVSTVSLKETTIHLVQLQQLDNYFSILAVIYFSLLALYTIQFGRHYSKICIVSTQGLYKPAIDIRLYTLNTALHLGIKKKVAVWLSEHIEVPSVIGFIKPIILLPLSIINNLSPEQVNAILLHELAHVKRNDYLLNLIQSFFELILFFNPFAIFLSSTIRKERENCCDDWVLTYQYNRQEYAKALLTLEEQRQLYLPIVLTATNNKKFLLQRIKRLIATTAPKTSISFLQKIKLLCFSIFLLGGICFFLPSFSYYKSQKKYLIKKVVNIIPIQLNKPLQKAEIKLDIFSPIIIDKGLVQLSSKKSFTRPLSLSKKQKSKSINENEYLLALVNEEEMFNKKQYPKTVPIAIQNQEKDSMQSFFVKIQEEQSGKQQINTYYFNLKDNNGAIEIKPLIIFKKFKVGVEKKVGIKKLSLRKSVILKTRITT